MCAFMRKLRLIIALIAGVLALEVCARVDDCATYGAPFWRAYSADSMYKFDGAGKRGLPGASYRQWHLNNMGFRGPDVRPGGIRVVCIGASETLGLYEDAGEEFPRQLERDLNRHTSHSDFQVINAAIAGQSIRTANLQVPAILDELKPQFAVIYPTPANYIWLPFLQHTTAAGPEPRLTDRIRDSTKRYLPDSVQDYLRRREIEKNAPAFGPEMSRIPDENVAAYRSDLSAMIDQLRARNITPILVTHASRFGAELSEKDRRLLTTWRRFYPMLREKGFLDMERRMNEAVRSLAAEKRVPLVDAAANVPPGDRYFVDMVHFTNEGSEVMSSLISGAVLSQKPIL
jgi:lysophospholipase L1-like esterase